MTSESAIEAALSRLTDEAAVEEAMVAFATEQAPFVQYLRTDTFSLLTEDERDYLQYLALVVYAAVADERERVPTLRGEAIEEWEERCWGWLEASVGKPMSARLDAFFDNIDEEELLAFAEDSLVDPEPEEQPEAALFASGPSRELGIVALAVLIGGLTAAQRERSRPVPRPGRGA